MQLVRAQLTTVCLADPGCYRAIHALAASLPGGRLEVIALAATGEGSAQDAFDNGPAAPAAPAAAAEPAAAPAGQRRAPAIRASVQMQWCPGIIDVGLWTIISMAHASRGIAAAPCEFQGVVRPKLRLT